MRCPGDPSLGYGSSVTCRNESSPGSETDRIWPGLNPRGGHLVVREEKGSPPSTKLQENV